MINWKVRIKNPNFWIHVVISVIVPVMTYFGLTGADFTTWQMVFDTALNAIRNPYVVVSVIVSVWNAVLDPTTAGEYDGNRAMTYIAPGVVGAECYKDVDELKDDEIEVITDEQV